MAQTSETARVVGDLKSRLEGVAKNLVFEVYGPDGMPWGTAFSELEDVSVELGRPEDDESETSPRSIVNNTTTPDAHPGFEASNPSLQNVQFKPNDLRLHASPAESVFGHVLDLFQSIRTRQEPVAPFEQGHRATTIGNVSDITVRLDRKFRWDWESETFDDDQANAMMSRPMREPYTI